MTRQEKFEAYFTASRGLETGSLAQYRFSTIERYRLPDLARAYRDFCAGMDAVVVDLPQQSGANPDWNQAIRYCHQAVLAAGGKVRPH